jgi:hypothetical protein
LKFSLADRVLISEDAVANAHEPNLWGRPDAVGWLSGELGRNN